MEIKEAFKRIPGIPVVARLLKGQPAQDPRGYLLGKMPKESVCAEIGVWEGQFSRRIMRRVRPKRLHLIDPWKHVEESDCHDSWYSGLGEGGQVFMDGKYEDVRKLFDSEISKGLIVIHRQYSSDAVGEFDSSYFDWIYIDGNHQYDFVKRDLELYYPKVKAGGFIAGDDYGLEGWLGGVRKAVDEFIQSNKSNSLTLEIKGDQYITRKELLQSAKKQQEL